MPALCDGGPSDAHQRAGPHRVDVGQVLREGLGKVQDHLGPATTRAHLLVTGQVPHVVRRADLCVELPVEVWVALGVASRWASGRGVGGGLGGGVAG